MNDVTSPTARTGLQSAIVYAALRLVTVLPDPDLVISAEDIGLSTLLGVPMVSFVWNLIERRLGRKVLQPSEPT